MKKFKKQFKKICISLEVETVEKIDKIVDDSNDFRDTRSSKINEYLKKQLKEEK